MNATLLAMTYIVLNTFDADFLRRLWNKGWRVEFILVDVTHKWVYVMFSKQNKELIVKADIEDVRYKGKYIQNIEQAKELLKKIFGSWVEKFITRGYILS